MTWRWRASSTPGMLSLTLGVRYRSRQSYLEQVDDGLYVARYVRSIMVEGSLAAWLRGHHGEAWWTNRGCRRRRCAAAGRAGRSGMREDVVAHLGYDHLDWRPVLRQIRTLLIGEMSGYGGPNITTRAGTRKV